MARQHVMQPSIFIIIVFAGYCLKCYHFSTRGLPDKCTADREEKPCPFGSDRCGTVHIEVKVGNQSIGEDVAGDCLNATICNHQGSCRALFYSNHNQFELSKCEINCCSGDLCNRHEEQSPEHRLICYQCVSTKSWDDCDTNSTEQACPSGTVHCGAAHVEGKMGNVSVARFIKRCSTSAVCNHQDNCRTFTTNPSTNITKCEVTCCREDLCNGYKTPTVLSTKGWDYCITDVLISPRTSFWNGFHYICVRWDTSSLPVLEFIIIITLNYRSYKFHMRK